MRLLLGDCFEKIRELEDNSVDALVTDPPYGWRFMGKSWDAPDIERVAKAKERGGMMSDGKIRKPRDLPAESAGTYDLSLPANKAFQEWTERWAKEVFRVLKPGAHALIFCGPRTYHRMAAGVEDAGFEIRDQLQWIFGSGFPKSLNVEKAGAGSAWAGFGTALKPANEPILLARKPLSEKTVAANVQKWGTGAINIDGSRIGTEQIESGRHGRTECDSAAFGKKLIATEKAFATGRFPANLLFSHNPDCDEQCSEGCAVAALDAQSGLSKSTAAMRGERGRHDAGMTPEMERRKEYSNSVRGHSDSGGASRFFYCAKCSTSERNAGMGEMKNSHPTLKPQRLMRYLCRLITPPGGVVLDPFMGSGSTGLAAKSEGFKFIGIEREQEYFEISERRIAANV